MSSALWNIGFIVFVSQHQPALSYHPRGNFVCSQTLNTYITEKEGTGDIRLQSAMGGKIKIVILSWLALSCLLLFLQIVWHPNIMTSITDPNMSDRFTNAMEEIHNKHLKTYGEIIDTTTELCQSHRQLVKSALGMIEILSIVYWAPPLFLLWL